MAQETMYAGEINSPATTITNNIGVADTLLYVLDPARVPTSLPNLMTLGTGTNGETVLIQSIADNLLTVQRGFQGIAKEWPAGTVIARNFTEYDHAAFKANIEDLVDELNALAGVGRTTETVKGTADAIDTHEEDTTSHILSTERTDWNSKAAGNHNHDAAYSAIGHNHTGVYEPADADIMKKDVAQTMSAKITAQANTDYTTGQVRNITLSTNAPSGGNNGDIWIKYTA